jgi:modulator of FtsH protease
MPIQYEYPLHNQAPGVPAHFVDVTGQLERNAFLRKVFGLVFIGLLFTGLGGYLGLVSGASLALMQHPLIAIAAYFGLFFGAQAGRHVAGLNFLLLGAFTAFTGFYLAPIVAMAGPTAAGNALATTSVIFLGLSAYASTTKRDFSFLGAFVFTAILALIVGSLLNGFVFHSAAAQGAFAVVGAFIFSAAILFDVWRLSRTLSFDEPIAFALTLYLDFINLFLYVLQIFGRRRD